MFCAEVSTMTKTKKTLQRYERTHLKVVWAMDALGGGLNLSQSGAAAVLKSLGAKAALEIIPVFVLNLVDLELWSEATALDIDDYQPAALRNMKRALASVKFLKTAPPQILKPKVLARRDAALTLADHARKVNADLIICDTHGRKGLARLILGSFAETLVLCSSVPVISCNPLARKVHPMKDILFVTDLSKESHRAFRRVLKLAGALNAKVTMLHAVPIPANPVMESGAALLGGAWVPLGTYFSTESQAQKKRANAWVVQARKAGVPCEAIIATRVPSVTAAVEATVRRIKPALVACTAQSSRVQAVLLGSITRNLLRRMQVPVLVTRP
mgnify:CR=1 FL=1